MIGDNEKEAKNAVEEHKIRGSLRSSNPKAPLNAPAMHLKLSISIFSQALGKQSLCPTIATSPFKRHGVGF